MKNDVATIANILSWAISEKCANEKSCHEQIYQTSSYKISQQIGSELNDRW